MSKPKLTVLDAVRYALKRRWLIESEIQQAVYNLTGRWISGSNATARCRELKARCRHLHGRRWEYRLGT
jgi:hypothetical protein